MDANEEYVRSVWEPVLVWTNERTGEPRIGMALFMNWSAAAEFTREHKEQVRKAKLSAQCLNHWGAISKGYPGQIEAFEYLTALLNTELARLTAGMKPQKAGSK